MFEVKKNKKTNRLWFLFWEIVCAADWTDKRIMSKSWNASYFQVRGERQRSAQSLPAGGEQPCFKELRPELELTLTTEESNVM